MSQPNPTVIVQKILVGPYSTPLVCPHCRAQIRTQVEYEPGVKTHILAAIICTIGGWLCCLSFMPYLYNNCKVANHYCPSCGAFIASYDN